MKQQHKTYMIDQQGASVDLSTYVGMKEGDTTSISLTVTSLVSCTIDCSSIVVGDCEIDIRVQAGAQVQLLWDHAEHSLHQVRRVRIILERNALCTTGFFGVVSGSVHTALSIELAGEHSEAYVTILGAAREHGNHACEIMLTHQVPQTISSIRARDLVFDAASSRFSARTIMQQGVRDADGTQEHKALLFSDYAHAESFPEIEVATDTISCAHASAIGQLSDDQLDYLIAKSIDPVHAKRLLMHAFILQLQHHSQASAVFFASFDRFLDCCRGLL